MGCYPEAVPNGLLGISASKNQAAGPISTMGIVLTLVRWKWERPFREEKGIPSLAVTKSVNHQPGTTRAASPRCGTVLEYFG